MAEAALHTSRARSPAPAPVATKPRVLVVDDEIALAETIADGLEARGYDAIALSSANEAARRLADERVDALVTDLRMPEMDGLELLSISRDTAPDRPVIVMTAYSAIDSAIDSIRRGAYHYLTKPFKVDELALFLDRSLENARVRREAVALRRTLRDRFGIDKIVGRSAGMREVCDLIERIADSPAPVLLTGETGTGKGLVAHAIHAQGKRAGAPFVTVNCAALPEALLESELFGHVKGAFTGATTARVGLFEEANHGTIFLDEIGEMSAALQAKLLHVLESGRVRAVGSNRERTTDVRVIAATHRDLRQRVTEGTFRQDLLYRLEVVAIEIPPLRRRREDIPPLIQYFLDRARERQPETRVVRIGAEAMARMFDHEWPGNVRELEHVIERLVLLGQGPEVLEAELPPTVRSATSQRFAFEGPVVPLRTVIRQYVAWAFERLNNQKLATADKLEIDIKTFRRWLNDTPDDNGAPPAA